jgi:hypothetical protein
MTLRMHFAPTGRAALIYDDAARPVMDALGAATVRRVSNVEPNEQGEWVASMINGPQLPPCRKRADALRLEVDWINGRLGYFSA